MARDDTIRAIQEIRRLRRAEREADRRLRPELRAVREFLEETTGPTITRAETARLMGISQTALDRWVTRGEIASVLTPRGRREIPIAEVVELLEEVEEARGAGSERPLAAVIRERRRAAATNVDLDRLLPRKRGRSHRVAELQALAYHRLVAERLTEELVDDARRRLERWRREGRIDPRWAAAWERILELPPAKIAESISADTRRASDLRQTSPFIGGVTEQERRRLLRAVEERALA